jgi:hypothetical protein
MSHDHLVLVLGVARSGTSSVAGALAATGVYFGEELKTPDEQNPMGNFEDLPLSQLNQKILAASGRSWSSVRKLPKSWQQLRDVKRNRDLIKQELEDRFSKRGLVGIKDPRLVLLFPLYCEVLNELDLNYTVVTTTRARSEVVKSIRASGYFHGSFETLLSPLLVARYEALIRAIASETATFNVDFRALIADPRTTLSLLLKTIPYQACGIVPDIDAAVAHIDPSLYRNREQS